MGVESIPAKYLHKCDLCGVEVVNTSNGLPYRWARVKLEREAYDYSGCPVADGSVSWYCCESCQVMVEGWMNHQVEIGKDSQKTLPTTP